MINGLDIAFFGSSLVSSYWNGAATYYRGIVRALHRLGHRVTFYEPDILDRQRHRDLGDPEWARVVVYRADDTTEVATHLRRAALADVVVKASGVGVFDAYLEREVATLGEQGSTVVFWDVDAPSTLDRLLADPADPFRALIPRFNRILTYGGGPQVELTYCRLGARSCAAIYNAHDPETHHPTAPDPRFSADLAFLGNRMPDREERVEDYFLRCARLLPERRFLLGGSGWDADVLPDNVRYLGHVGSADHNAFNVTPLAVLNVNRASMARYGHSPATRIFEAAAAGACIISDSWAGLDEFLEPGTEILVAADGAEVADVLADLQPGQAAWIGAAARRRVLAEHTYLHRAEQLADLLCSTRRSA